MPASWSMPVGGTRQDVLYNPGGISLLGAGVWVGNNVNPEDRVTELITCLFRCAQYMRDFNRIGYGNVFFSMALGDARPREMVPTENQVAVWCTGQFPTFDADGGRSTLWDSAQQILITSVLEHYKRAHPDITDLGTWYIVGDSITSPDGSNGQVPPTRSWAYLLQDRGVLNPVVNATGGRGIFYNGFSTFGYGPEAGWTVDDCPDGVNALIYLGTNDAINAGLNTFNIAYVRLITALQDKNAKVFVAYPPDLKPESVIQPYIASVRNWLDVQRHRLNGDIFMTEHLLDQMVDGLHGNQVDQENMADLMYKQMITIVRQQAA